MSETVNQAHYDSSGASSAMGVIGTLGTADIGGTARTLPIGVDPLTGAAYVYNLAPQGSVEIGTISIGGTNPAEFLPVRLTDGTAFYNAEGGAGGGTVVQVNNGSIVVTAGTVTTTMGDLTGGTIDLITRVSTIGTLEVGTISSLPALPAGNNNIGDVDVATLPNIPGGTLGLVTTVTNLTNGTIQNSGTVTGVGVVSALTSGTVSVNTAGTIASGSIAVTAGTIASVGTVPGVGVVTSVTNLAGGTVQVNPRPTKQISTIGSIWGTTSGTAGTLVAAPGVGTSIYVNDLSIVNEGTANLTAIVGYGTAQQGTTVLKRAAMPGNGGIQASFPVPVSGNITNLPIVISTTGSGTAAFNLTYWIE